MQFVEFNDFYYAIESSEQPSHIWYNVNDRGPPKQPMNVWYEPRTCPEAVADPEVRAGGRRGGA